MFRISKIRILESCDCDTVQHGNRPRIKSAYSPGLTAAMMGWDVVCRVPDYDDLAQKESAWEK